ILEYPQKQQSKGQPPDESADPQNEQRNLAGWRFRKKLSLLTYWLMNREQRVMGRSIGKAHAALKGAACSVRLVSPSNR
ncbi:hypothetical protein M9458_029668, partial [Cirrhinus mrigala]